jgi:hypothetical protein
VSTANLIFISFLGKSITKNFWIFVTNFCYYSSSEALFEFISGEEHQPCIVLIKNIERTVLYNYERYVHFKNQFEKLSNRVVVFGISTTNEIRKDKTNRQAPGFLLSKGGSGGTHTTLLDLSFLDQFSRGEQVGNIF